MKSLKTRFIAAFLWLTLLVIAPGASGLPAEPQRPKPTDDQSVVVRKLHLIRTGELSPPILIIGGGLVVEEGAAVDGDAVVLLGDVTVHGQVAGDVISLFGDLSIRPSAEINGDVFALGSANISGGATIEGERVLLSLGDSAGWKSFIHWLEETALQGRPWSPGMPWMWAGVILLTAGSMLLGGLFPAHFHQLAATLRTRPPACFGAGLLVAIALPAVVLVLIATVVGIVLLPFLAAAFVLIAITAFIAAGLVLGQTLGLRGMSAAGTAAATGAGVAVGFLLLGIPFAGFAVLSLVGLWSIGGLTLHMLALGSVTGSDRIPNPEDNPAANPHATAVADMPAGASGFPAPETVGPREQAAEPGGIPPERAPQPTPSPAVTGAALQTAGVRVGFWPRFAAVLLDAILIGITVGFLERHAGLDDDLFGLSFLLYTLLFWTFKGTTLGGAVLGLQIRRIDGTRLGFGGALIRALGTFIALAPFGIGWFWASWSGRRQAWQDLIADTEVVRMPAGSRIF